MAPEGETPRGGGLEARLVRLESDVVDVKATLARFESPLCRAAEDLAASRSDLRAAKSDLAGLGPGDLTDLKLSMARLEARVSRLPSAMQMAGFVLAVLAFAGVARFTTGP